MNYLQIGAIAALVFIDQFTKYLIKTNLALYESKDIFSFLSLTYIHNTGIAFGVFQNKDYSNLILIFVMIAIIGVFIYNQKSLTELGSKTTPAALVFIYGGAFGNLIDRIFVGKVVDFIDFHFFPVFNAADSCITIGGILLFLSFILKRNDKKLNA
ncbi:MAG: signal peptidase II [Elusimicrobia bacterium RIFOXYA2_FULL_39_19]|nr:MAG: signal peptidase II [Elusimicrobia bacterium RIFOXYA2_FULL_39_19]